MYYQPGKHVLFEAGQVAEIEVNEGDGPAVTTNYYAHIQNYVAFEPEVILKGAGESNLKNEVSFLKEKDGSVAYRSIVSTRLAERITNSFLTLRV